LLTPLDTGALHVYIRGMRRPKNALRVYKKNSGLTWRAIAEQLGVTLDAVNKWATYARVPRHRHIIEIARLANRPVEEVLLDFSKNAKPSPRPYCATTDGAEGESCAPAPRGAR
jgi:transcriptional regulator with XRE-family HTH domain